MNFGNFGFPQKQLAAAYTPDDATITIKVNTNVVAGDVIGYNLGQYKPISEKIEGGDIVLAPEVLTMYTSANTLVEAVATTNGCSVTGLSGGNFVIGYAGGTGPRFRIVNETDLSMVSNAVAVSANGVVNGSIHTAAMTNGNFVYGYIDSSASGRPTIGIYSANGSTITAPLPIESTGFLAMDIVVRANNQIIVGMCNSTAIGWVGCHPNGSVQSVYASIQTGITGMANGISMAKFGESGEDIVFGYAVSIANVSSRAIDGNNAFIAANSAPVAIVPVGGMRNVATNGYKRGFSVNAPSRTASQYTGGISGNTTGQFIANTIVWIHEYNETFASNPSHLSTIVTAKGETFNYGIADTGGVMSISPGNFHYGATNSYSFFSTNAGTATRYGAIGISTSHRIAVSTSTAAGVSIWVTNPIYSACTIPSITDVGKPGYTELSLNPAATANINGEVQFTDKTILAASRYASGSQTLPDITAFTYDGSKIGTRGIVVPRCESSGLGGTGYNLIAKRSNTEFVVATNIKTPTSTATGGVIAVTLMDKFANILSPVYAFNDAYSTQAISAFDIKCTSQTQEVAMILYTGGSNRLARIANNFTSASNSGFAAASSNGRGQIVPLTSNNSFVVFYDYDTGTGNIYAVRFDAGVTSSADVSIKTGPPAFGFALEGNGKDIIYNYASQLIRFSPATMSNSTIMLTGNSYYNNSEYNTAGQLPAFGKVIGNTYFYHTTSTQGAFDIVSNQKLYSFPNNNIGIQNEVGYSGGIGVGPGGNVLIFRRNSVKTGQNTVVYGVAAESGSANSNIKVFTGTSSNIKTITLSTSYPATVFDTRTFGGIKGAVVGPTAILQGY